jgi:hypothetical protein
LAVVVVGVAMKPDLTHHVVVGDDGDDDGDDDGHFPFRRLKPQHQLQLDFFIPFVINNLTLFELFTCT